MKKEEMKKEDMKKEDMKKGLKVFIVSDTHGKHGNLETALEQVGKIDCFIHLGDVGDGLDYLNAIVDCEKYIVGGNGDFFAPLPRECEFLLGDKKVFITHGHKYISGGNMGGLLVEGMRRGVDIVMFGHTHMPYLETISDLILLNPGSISLPRQKGRAPSFMLMEMSPDGEVGFQPYFLGGNNQFVSLGHSNL